MGPFGKGLVGGDDGGGVLFVTMADNLEEHGRHGLIEAEVADFIDDQQSGLRQHSNLDDRGYGQSSRSGAVSRVQTSPGKSSQVLFPRCRA